MDVIYTQRLEIKPFSGKEKLALSSLLTQQEIRKTYMIPDFPDEKALESMASRFTDLSYLQTRFVRGIYLQGALIGFVNDVEIENGSIELGYVIHPDFWGQGYATEMLKAVIIALFDRGFSRITAGAFAENAASLRVMEKCAMTVCSQNTVLEYRGQTHRCVFCQICRPPETTERKEQ